VTGADTSTNRLQFKFTDSVEISEEEGQFSDEIMLILDLAMEDFAELHTMKVEFHGHPMMVVGLYQEDVDSDKESHFRPLILIPDAHTMRGCVEPLNPDVNKVPLSNENETKETDG